jgi:hypothetical protein
VKRTGRTRRKVTRTINMTMWTFPSSESKTMTTYLAKHGDKPSQEEPLYWECPDCGAYGRDPLTITQALCRNGHVVALGMRTGPTTRTAYPAHTEDMSRPMGGGVKGTETGRLPRD